MSFSLKSIKYEYQHCTSSINESISIDINIFGVCKSKKLGGAVGKWGTISKKIVGSDIAIV